MAKFTFKTDKPTGQWKWLDSNTNHIKLNGNPVGEIEDSNPVKIRLMIIKSDILEDGNANCDWKWITLNRNFTSLDEAKIWLNENINLILGKWKLREEKD